jgi:CHAD domain-containing protein
LAVITTSREIHELVNAEGRVLAELVVDAVSAHAVNEPEVIRQWREVEVELVDGTDKLLRRAAKWLRAAGASDPSWRSKLAMAIGAEPPPAPDLGTLRGLFEAYLGGQHDAILRGDLDLRRGRDAIHDTRVATRRCRSVLRVYSGALDQERAAALDAELAWFATVLGEVRDRDVLRVHLVAAVDALPTTLVVGPVREQLTAVLDAEHATATTELAAAMRSRRYFAMLRELRVWRDQQPGLGDQSADHAADHLALAERKIRRRLRRLPDGGPERDAAIHRVRKAAKRARYAAELAEPALGKQAAAVGKRSKKLQRRLGDRQDHVLAAEFLLRVAQAGGGGFTLGVLHEREYRQAHAIA